MTSPKFSSQQLHPKLSPEPWKIKVIRKNTLRGALSYFLKTNATQPFEDKRPKNVTTAQSVNEHSQEIPTTEDAFFSLIGLKPVAF